MTELRDWIALLIDATGKWRMEVADRHPDDVRNRHSAAALHDLARIIRQLAPDDFVFEKMIRYVDVAGHDVEFIHLPDELGRFGFDLTPTIVTYSDAAETLNLFYDANLRWWRSGDADPDAVPADLAVLLDFELGPPRDDDLEHDAIEDVHARIDRLEKRLTQVERQLAATR